MGEEHTSEPDGEKIKSSCYKGMDLAASKATNDYLEKEYMKCCPKCGLPRYKRCATAQESHGHRPCA